MGVRASRPPSSPWRRATRGSRVASAPDNEVAAAHSRRANAYSPRLGAFSTCVSGPDAIVELRASGDVCGHWDPDRLSQVVATLSATPSSMGTGPPSA